MKTFMEKPANVERKWYLVDATNMPLGRLASQVADILTGKNKPTYTPHVDTGDHVIVINSDKVILTGKKLTQKMLRSHSGYVDGQKEMDNKTGRKTKWNVAIEKAVKGKSRTHFLGRKAFERLRVYKDANHNHDAQKPQTVELKGARN